MTAGRPRVVVVGNGMAGFRFTQELIALDAGADVTVIGDEPGGAYNRAQLPLVLAGAVRENSIELADESWYAARGVRLVTGTVPRIDRAGRVVETARGVAVPYDVLVLAAGSAPVLPPVRGLTGPDGRLLPGAVAFRTLADCAEIRALAGCARRAVVLGGGVLGVETARALAACGLPVTLVHRGSRLMERQLDARAHGLVAPAWAQATAAARAVADFGAGCPGAGCPGAGCPGVNRLDAVGADAPGSGPPGRVRRGGTAGYAGMPAVVRLKAAGIELAVLGSAHGGGAEVVRFTDPARGVYQKLVVRDGRLAGAILLGDSRAAGTLTQLFDRGAAPPADRASLLAVRGDATAAVAGSPHAMPANTTVCHCNGVTKAGICAAWQDGARDADEVTARTRASTGCGTCRDAVEGIVAWLAAAEPGLVPA